jgi:CRISPR-associated protein Cmr5
MGGGKMSQISNLEHERANEAWSCVDYVNSEEKPAFKKEYRSIVMKSPTLILSNGLGQTLAFLKSKGKCEEKLYKDIEGWLDKRIKWAAKGELMEKIISLPNDTFRHATTETLSFLSWLKRFADAVLPKEGD